MTPDEKHDTNIIDTFNKNDFNCKLEKNLLQKVNFGYTYDTFHIIGFFSKASYICRQVFDEFDPGHIKEKNSTVTFQKDTFSKPF